MKYIILALLVSMSACTTKTEVPDQPETKPPVVVDPKPSEPPVVTPPNPTPDPLPTSSIYPIYQGCVPVSQSFKRTLYVDAVSGSDTNSGDQSAPLKTILISKIQPGDHVIIVNGQHGILNITGSRSAPFKSALDWTWFEFKGLILMGLDLRDVQKILVTGAIIKKATGDIVSLNSSKDIIVSGNQIQSADDFNLTAQAWMSLASAVNVRNGQCVSVSNNKVKAVRSGLTAMSDALAYPQNSMKVLFEGNDMQGFSADASRALASDVVIRKNKFIDGYVGQADGDGNHDDMFQGFALNGKVFENIVVEENYMHDNYTSNRPFKTQYQGVSIFDGLYKNVIVRKNIVVGGAYHGITLAGIDGGLVESNTVVTNNGRKYWISINASKTGVSPKNVTVKNNLAMLTKIGGTTININNLNIVNPKTDFVSFDEANSVYDFNLKTSSPLYGKGAGAF